MKTLYHMSTRGNLYSIALYQLSDGTFQIKEFKHNQEQACAVLGSTGRDSAVIEFNRRIDDAAKYDGVHFVKAVI